jgi:hypothetical protein
MAPESAAWPPSFQVIDARSHQPVLSGTPTRLEGHRWGACARLAELDFSRLDTPGSYQIVVGNTRSDPFEIRPAILVGLSDDLLDFMRQQRCGYNPWLKVECHQSDGRTAYGPRPPGTEIDAVGGWHDAGDLLKYQLTSGNATAQMLLAYTVGRAEGRTFTDRVDARGDDGPNGVPDLLDEARWGLDWLLKLHPCPGELYHQVADDRDHTRFRLPQNEIADYGWGAGGPRVVYAADGKPQGLKQYQSASNGLANLAGRYAAAMALAYQIWKDDPKERPFAERCLAAGREVYALGRAHEGVQQGNSFGAPYRYEETTWADDMEWGAAELLRATGEPQFRDDALRDARLAASDHWMGRETAGHYQFYPFQNAGHFRLFDQVDAPTRSELAGYYRDGLERAATAAEKHPLGLGVPPIWCSNNLAVALVTQCRMYARMTGDHRFDALAARNRDWLLGRNPWGYTMFTQVGTQFPTDVHLQTTKLTGRNVRGGLVDGPVARRIFTSLKGVAITEPDPLAPFQDDRAVYHNDIQDYSTNEPTMDGTASAVLMWALERAAAGLPSN